MKIESLKINNFGKIKDQQIDLKENINIIYGENESGKSTILKFITSMLYGINRNKAGNYASDYERFTPWSEKDFSGKMTYKLDNGEKYEIYRDFTKKNPKIFNENMEEISKQFTIDKTKGNKFFIDQTQVDEELFLSTIVAEQQAVRLEIKEQNSMIQKMTNIIGTGEDSVSINNAISKLNKKITNDIGTKNTKEKPINLLEKRKQELEEDIKILKNFDYEKYAIDETKKEEEIAIKEKENELEFAKRIQEIQEDKKIKKERINLLKETEEEKRKEIQELKEKLNNIETPKIQKINKKTHIIITSIILILGIIGAVCLKGLVPKVISLLIATILDATIIFNLSKKITNNKNIKEENYRKIKNYENEIEKQEDILENKVNENKKQENEIESEYKAKIENIKSEFLNRISEEKMYKISNIQFINETISELQESINESKLNIHRIELDQKNVLPKLENLSEKIEELENVNEDIEALEFLAKAIYIAKENIEQAYSEMKNEISPKFTKELSETIQNISNGKYSKVKLNDEYGLIVENEKGDYVPVAALSTGTIEQLYLSLRLATVDNVSTEKLPIILDEPFVYFDDERLKNVLQFLKEKYSNRQIIIFTCTNREENAIKQSNYQCNVVSL